MMSDAKTDDTSYTGFVRSLEDALQVVKAYELATKSRFVCIMRPRLFGRKGNLTCCCNIEHVCTVVQVPVVHGAIGALWKEFPIAIRSLALPHPVYFSQLP